MPGMDEGATVRVQRGRRWRQPTEQGEKHEEHTVHRRVAAAVRCWLASYIPTGRAVTATGWVFVTGGTPKSSGRCEVWTRAMEGVEREGRRRHTTWCHTEAPGTKRRLTHCRTHRERREKRRRRAARGMAAAAPWLSSSADRLAAQSAQAGSWSGEQHRGEERGRCEVVTVARRWGWRGGEGGVTQRGATTEVQHPVTNRKRC